VSPFRFIVALVLVLGPLGAAAAADVISASGPCRTDFVIPYSEQCMFAYQSVHKDRSPQNLQNAFTTCDRSQSASLACVKSPTRQIHVVALNALYTAVSAQSEIAMFAGQYAVAEALLREKLGVIQAIGQEARPGDRGLDEARASTESDIADSLAGQCTWKALASAGRQQQLIRAHDYGDLTLLLQKKSADYETCSRLAATPPHKAYVEYLGYVALEESGRAAQAAGRRDAADHLYRACIDGTTRSTSYATHAVKNLLATVNTLCRGRMSGKYRVDQPEPIDADDGRHFRPLTLPKS